MNTTGHAWETYALKPKLLKYCTLCGQLSVSADVTCRGAEVFEMYQQAKGLELKKGKQNG